MISGCDCRLQQRPTFQHWTDNLGVLYIDEIHDGLSSHYQESLVDAVGELESRYEESLGTEVLTTFGHTEIHLRDDLIPCRWNGYHCHGCSSVGYLSNGGPLIWVSTIDSCSIDYLVTQELDKLVPKANGYDYREFDYIPSACGLEIDDCSLARHTLERTPVYNDFCTE